jgi:DNA-binding NarL/FixJ family response regulator
MNAVVQLRRAAGVGALAGKTMVVVDDRPAFVELLVASLSSVCGLKCAGVAGTASEGVDLVTAGRPDIVVIDVQLPDRSGLQAIQQLSAAHPGMLVVAASASSDPVWAAQAAEAGASAYIVKGGPLAEMIDVLTDLRPLKPVVPSCAASSSTARPVVAARHGESEPHRRTVRQHGHLSNGIRSVAVGHRRSLRSLLVRTVKVPA